MARPLFPRRTAATRGRYPFGLESLERRDCPAVVGIGVDRESIAEGGEVAVLTVVLSEPQRRAVKVGYVVTGDGFGRAVDTQDVRLSVGTRALASRSGTIEFRPGERVKQVRVTAVDDTLREGPETLRFALFRPRGCTVDPANASVDLAIDDNDAYTAAIVALSSSDVAEGEGVRFAIQLSSPATRPETFYVSTVDGTATSADYRSLRDMPVTILTGERESQPFTLNTVADSSEETDEYFLVTARPRSPDIAAIDPVGVTVRGTGPAPVTVSVTDASVVEGNDGLAACTFTVRLGAPALAPVTVQYATQDGTATAGVDYAPTAGSLTFASGQISKTITVNTIGDTVVEDTETFELLVTTGSGGAASGEASIRDDDTAFEITVTFPDTSLTPAQQQVFRTAARRWSEIIVGDLPDITVGGRLIDDIEITASAVPIDGAYGVLGSAGPRTFRSGPRGLPSTGAMQFDTADVTMMMVNNTFADVILHEMGHVIGIGTLWQGFNLVTGVGGPNPQYVGARGLAEYQTLLGSATAPTGVPVENQGGSGTRDAHWRESVFRTELMTGIAERPGVPMPISRLTVGSLEDLGYRVNYAAADPYSLPGSVTAPTASRSAGTAVALAMALEQQRGRQVARATGFTRLI